MYLIIHQFKKKGMDPNPISKIIDIVLNAVDHVEYKEQKKTDFIDLLGFLLKLQFKYDNTDDLNENNPTGEIFLMASRCVWDTLERKTIYGENQYSLARVIRNGFQVFNEVLEWHPFLKTYNPILIANLALLFNKLS